MSHIEELRRRLLWSLLVLSVAAVAAFLFYEQISLLLERPFHALNSSLAGSTFVVSTIIEGFLTRLRVSVLAGLVVSTPFHVVNLLGFVFPGLSRRERRLVLIAIAVSFVLIVASAYYGYSLVAPLSVRFLTGSGFVPERVGIILNYQSNILYLLKFLFATLIVFQIPILLEALLVLNVVSRTALLKASRYVIVAAFATAALITPPDFISQLTLAVPFIALYFLVIGIAFIFGFGSS